MPSLVKLADRESQTAVKVNCLFKSGALGAKKPPLLQPVKVIAVTAAKKTTRHFFTKIHKSSVKDRKLTL